MSILADSEPQKPVTIIVSADKMRAFLSLQLMPGQPFDSAQIFQELKEQGVVYGISLDRINSLCQKIPPFNNEIIAEGTPAVPGENAEIEYFFQKPSLVPELTDDGGVDYYNLGIVTQVNTGDILAVRKPATPGTEGYNLLGEVIQPMPGKHRNFHISKGVVVKDDFAIAEFDGAINWQGDKIGVSRMKLIKGDVDFSTGNIDFPGKLIVSGWIRSGFQVEADEDIEVRGGIEDAVVTSRQGSIFVHQGIAGRNNASIKAKINIEARYIQEADIEAGKNVVVNEYIIRSRIEVGNAVLLQGRKGKLMGHNQISAGSQIRVNSIQSNKDLSLIVAGIDRNKVFKELKRIIQLIEKEEEVTRALTLELRMLAGKKDIDSIELLKKLLPKYTNAVERTDMLKIQRDDRINLLRTTKGDGMIEVRDRVDYGTSFQIKNEHVKVNNELRNITLYYDSDEKRIIVINN